MNDQEHLGPMARSLVETFAGLTLPQQRRVLDLLHDVVRQNEEMAELVGNASGVSESRPAAPPD